MTWVANVVYLLAGALYLPVLLYQMIVQRKNRRGWAERFGWISLAPSAAPRFWVHAVSLGEINATPLLVAKLRQRLPGHEVIISTTTDTGYARACQLYDPACVFRYPLDFSWVVSRVLARVRPSLIVLVELEVWHNLVALAWRRGIPVTVVNGRLTQRSCRRFRWLGGIGRSMFRRLRWVGAQDQQIAERFRHLGVPDEHLDITGSLKWDTAQVADHIDGADALAAALGIDRHQPLWVCGSTGPDEEAIILDAYRRVREASPDVTLVIVPRKPERFDQVADLVRQTGYECTRRSKHPDVSAGNSGSAEAGLADGAGRPRVILGDTMGELRKFYSLADAVFVGRSLVPLGGSDPMEVAALAKPVVAGPHMDNFQLPVAALESADAIRTVRSAEDLAAEISRLCRDPAYARRLGEAARRVVLDQQGATDRTVDALARIVHAEA
jgi:3-deoxy-D-manno-octulosonic-acid transferase